VIGGIPCVEEPNFGRKLPIHAETKGLVCKFASGKDSKGKNSKNKKMGKPSEVEGMDVKTKKRRKAGQLLGRNNRKTARRQGWWDNTDKSLITKQEERLSNFYYEYSDYPGMSDHIVDDQKPGCSGWNQSHDEIIVISSDDDSDMRDVIFRDIVI
jgi:hypothetical protein